MLSVSGTVRERDPGELLFQADAAYQTELADGVLSPTFRALFSDVDTKYTLSEEIEVATRVAGTRWLLTDVKNNRTYHIVSEDVGEKMVSAFTKARSIRNLTRVRLNSLWIL